MATPGLVSATPRNHVDSNHSTSFETASLGIAAEMKPKTVLHPNARAAGALVANGGAEIGINLIHELMPLPGIDLVGPLPGDLQNNLVFMAAIMTSAKEPTAARALIDFLRTPEAAEVIKAKGMEPS
jgi:molybdate transport system substrate-binding protein